MVRNRGDVLEFCRLFVTENTHSVLLDIHENDQDYRLRLASNGKQYRTLDEARIALRESPSSRLTAKTGSQARRYNLTFSPINLLFKRDEVGSLARTSEQWAISKIRDINSRACRVVHSSNGDEMGLLSPG